MGFNYRILVVDDEPIIREISSAVLSKEGYEVRTADGGFAALAELRRSLPDLIISDLRMPNMSGFELLSVVRRRFPHIPVIAISGEYNGNHPNGLISDAFFTKGHYTPEQLFARIAGLLREAPLRPQLTRPDTAPVWVPRTSSEYVVLILSRVPSFLLRRERDIRLRDPGDRVHPLRSENLLSGVPIRIKQSNSPNKIRWVCTSSHPEKPI